MLTKASGAKLILASTASLILCCSADARWTPPLESDGRETLGFLRAKNGPQEELSAMKRAQRSAYALNTTYQKSASKLKKYIDILNELFNKQKKAHEKIDDQYKNKYKTFVRWYQNTVQNPVDISTLSQLTWRSPDRLVFTCNNDTSKEDQHNLNCTPPQEWTPFEGVSAKQVLEKLSQDASNQVQKQRPQRGNYPYPPALDLNGDGVVSREELKRINRNGDGLINPNEISAIDANSNGIPDHLEFQHGRTPPLTTPMHKELERKELERINRNGDGLINPNEISAIDANSNGIPDHLEFQHRRTSPLTPPMHGTDYSLRDSMQGYTDDEFSDSEDPFDINVKDQERSGYYDLAPHNINGNNHESSGYYDIGAPLHDNDINVQGRRGVFYTSNF